MRRTLNLAAIAIAAFCLPFAALAQAPAKAEGGTEGSGIKPTTEQPRFEKLSPEHKAVHKAERQAVRKTAQGGPAMTDGSVATPAQEQPALAKKTPEQKLNVTAKRKQVRNAAKGGAPMTDGSPAK